MTSAEIGRGDEPDASGSMPRMYPLALPLTADCIEIAAQNQTDPLPVQLILPLFYLDRRRLNVRIHGRPRSDRKKRFLLSAVAPSTNTQGTHAKQGPSTGHSAVGLRQARENVF
jgi:hypothetical protein